MTCPHMISRSLSLDERINSMADSPIKRQERDQPRLRIRKATEPAKMKRKITMPASWVVIVMPVSPISGIYQRLAPKGSRAA